VFINRVVRKQGLAGVGSGVGIGKELIQLANSKDELPKNSVLRTKVYIKKMTLIFPSENITSHTSLLVEEKTSKRFNDGHANLLQRTIYLLPLFHDQKLFYLAHPYRLLRPNSPSLFCSAGLD